MRTPLRGEPSNAPLGSNRESSDAPDPKSERQPKTGDRGQGMGASASRDKSFPSTRAETNIPSVCAKTQETDAACSIDVSPGAGGIEFLIGAHNPSAFNRAGVNASVHITRVQILDIGFDRDVAADESPEPNASKEGKRVSYSLRFKLERAAIASLPLSVLNDGRFTQPGIVAQHA